MSNQTNYLDANPTKEFFIDMLTRDIRLDRAIIDLIDNSIDGAKSKVEKENYSGLYVNISAKEDEFEIRDNCGGFPLKVAREYAFKFGRPPEAKFVNHSIGRFGVGMKRALFKIGKSFSVESKHKSDHFLVDVIIKDWLEQSDGNDWGFKYYVNGEIPESKKKLLNGENGTVITVRELYDTVSSDFGDDAYLIELEREISLALSYSFLKGLKITLNNYELIPRDIDFLVSKEIKPYFKEIKNDGVTVKIYAGIGNPDPNVVGWYIFCNDRLVLEADTSNLTGWRETPDDEESGIVKYNNKHAMFRGVVHFIADNSKKLPMTTTKTGIDTDHPVYKMVKPSMKTALRQVTIFTNKIKDKEERNVIVNNSNSIKITEIKEKENEWTPEFKGPEISTIKTQSQHVSICFTKDREEVERLKEYLGVSKNYEVGQKVYEYFMNMKGNEI